MRISDWSSDVCSSDLPVLKRHGFALSFRSDFTNGIRVVGVLTHSGGNKETTDFVLPADGSGNKNAVQAIASSVSYGKRYTAGALLNLTSHGEDDDAFRAAVELVSDEQAATLHALSSEERRVGQGCVSTSRSRWSEYQSKKKRKRNETYRE